MENLTTYEFYVNTYYGDAIGKSAFPKWLSRATDKLMDLTYGNIIDDTYAEYESEIQKATCALMDLMYQIETATRTAMAKDETNVKSRSSGGESITYGDTDTLITKVLSDKAAQNRLMYDTVAEYLSGTGLLYAGV